MALSNQMDGVEWSGVDVLSSRDAERAGAVEPCIGGFPDVA
jgi:hypothetical protein